MYVYLQYYAKLKKKNGLLIPIHYYNILYNV